MSTQIRVLMLEDNSLDADLAVRELERAGFQFEWRRVDEEPEFLEGLDWKPDVILADSNLPQFDGMRALDLLNGRGVDIPFLLVSGSVGEDFAVQAIQRGACDYLLKDRLARLGPAVKRAIDQRRLRSEKAAAAEALRRSEQRHRLISEIVSDYAYSLAIRPDGSIVCEWITEAFTRILGYSLDDVNALGWSSLWLPDDEQIAIQHQRALLAGAPTELEIRILTKSREIRWVRLYERPIWDDRRERIVSIIGAAQDYTSRRLLEQQLIQSQKMEAVGQLAGGVAHDFNNLLTVILGYSAMLREEVPPDSPLREGIDEIERASASAAGLTRQLLTFSRKHHVDLQPQDLNIVLAGVDRMLQRLVRENIQLVTRPAEDLWTVSADSGHLEQVIVNLVVNAIDAMSAGGTLTIETANAVVDEARTASSGVIASGAYVTMSVTDTGCGMDAETQARIFEPFFTTKGVGKGTGLGLSTVYGIVQQLQGHIDVRSAVGQGTCMKIYLPRSEAQRTESGEQPESAVPIGTESVLLVEDDDRVRSLVKSWLQTLGYRVIEAGSGEQAMDVSDAEPGAIDLLISDVVLPNTSGPELAQALRAKREDIVIIFMSGYSDEVALARIAQISGAVYLQKPFTPAVLAHKVREVLSAARGGSRCAQAGK